jgi:CubicO group peptidase (beta-lactamase class C family)
LANIGDFLALRIARAQRDNRLPGVSARIAQGGELVAVAATGLADTATGTLATPETVYRIGSITKTFTAALAVLLAADGTLDLGAPVEKYLPGTTFGTVSLRALLAHAGGIQREVPHDMWNSGHAPVAAELQDALGHVDVLDRPGVRWHYSNLGYVVIGQIISIASGTDCRDLITSRLLHPLAMADISWERPAAAATGYLTDPYADAVHEETALDMRATAPAGQLWSTVADLLA